MLEKYDLNFNSSFNYFFCNTILISCFLVFFFCVSCNRIFNMKWRNRAATTIHVRVNRKNRKKVKNTARRATAKQTTTNTNVVNHQNIVHVVHHHQSYQRRAAGNTAKRNQRRNTSEPKVHLWVTTDEVEHVLFFFV